MNLLLNNITIDWSLYRSIGHDFQPDFLQELLDRGHLSFQPKGYLIITNLGGIILNPKLDEQTLFFVYAEDAKNFAKFFLAHTKYDWFIQEVNSLIITTKQQLIIKKLGQD